jgi:hypothetical protein
MQGSERVGDEQKSIRDAYANILLTKTLTGIDPVLRPPPVRNGPGPIKVGIIGAGAAGLYAGMIIDSFGPNSGIKYEILEIADGITRGVGGRLFTYKFPGGLENDYYVRDHTLRLNTPH